MSQDRRTFLSTLGAAAVAARGPRLLGGLLAPRAAKLQRIGMELYTVRSLTAKDLAGTLAQLAKIGYKEVEFAGYQNHSATEVRAMLDQNGLTAPSAHIDLAKIESEADQTFADAKVVGHHWITVASLPRGPRQTADDWKQIAARFNAAGKSVQAAGFRFAFHNHNDVFRKAGDELPIDILMRETDPALVSYQMDVYWVVNGGGNPVDLLQRYPGRFKMLHLKDSMGAPDHKMADVGAGTIDFKAILARAKGIENYFVERDDPTDPMASAAASFNYLSRLEF
jgi:sugar phosphate isomerase/epimerase